MRLSELLGQEVRDRDGNRIGTVADVRLVQDARIVGGHDAAFRLSGFVVVERRHIRLFGYERRVGPFVLRRLVDRFCGNIVFVGWEDVEEVDEQVIRTRRAGHDYQPLSALPPARATSSV